MTSRGVEKQRKARVVGLGLCVMDHLYLVQGDAPGEERVRYVARQVAPGGMIATALAQAARLGADAHVLSLVGDDAEGRAVGRRLRALGVRTRHLLRSRELPTTVAVVIVDRDSGARRFVVPDRRGLERRAPAFDLSPIRAGAALLVDGHFPAQARRAVRRAREVGARVVADFHRPSPAVLALLPCVDYAVVPREFAQLWNGGRVADTLLRLRREFGATPVITLGAKGVVWLEGRRVRRLPARRVRVLDSTGAGDAFHGAFAAGIAQGLSLERTIERANRCGAEACTVLGGMGHLLGREGRQLRL
ncbi:MAG TPA: carbohydrate kinase family protein [Myxococcota bacterium]|nr:carbohydrate kinase family protein [Myxococcota bacterium]